jgi:hypothetical protein
MAAMIAEPPLEETIESWDAQRMLQSLSDQLRRIAPGDCCVHGEEFCLSCGIDWAVSQDIPLQLDCAGGGAAR